VSPRRAPTPTVVFDTYWRFAAERQAIYRRRLSGAAGPWTEDPILRTFRFTNAYRAADRTSQFLIRRVIYEGAQTHREIVFRTLLFRLFNLPSTWDALVAAFGLPAVDSFDRAGYGAALDDHRKSGARLYSAAYVIPPVPQMGSGSKHEQHLALVEAMLADGVDRRIAEAASLAGIFEILTSYPSLGRFLAFQLTIDLNYGPTLAFDEMDHIVAGPGASEGIAKCFSDRLDWSDEDIIRWVTERQADEFERRDLAFQDLWGRPLQLIDCQNLFCEIAKYSRVAHPEFTAPGGRHRIKRTYDAPVDPQRPWFPPKWGINAAVDWRPSVRAVEQLDLALNEVEPESSAALRPNRAPHPIRLQDRLLPLGRRADAYLEV
jgi:hypothetical protein